MAKRDVVMNLATCQPVEYKETAIIKALEEDQQLLAEPKHDGVQLNLTVEGTDVKFLSRAGIEFDALTGGTTLNFVQLVQLYTSSSFNQYPAGYVVQGELMALGADGQPLPSATTAGILRRKEAPEVPQEYRFVIFSVLPLDGIKSLKAIPVNRMMQNQHAHNFIWGLHRIAEQAHLKSYEDNHQISLEVVEQVTVYQLEDDGVEKDGVTIPSLMGYYRSQRERGMEGVVAWRINQPWHRGKKTGGWKIKPNETFDGQVIGFVQGKAEATKNLLVGFEVLLEDGTVVNADGLTDALSLQVTADPESYMGAVVEVSCMERFTNGSLRHPKFKAFRGINQLTVKE